MGNRFGIYWFSHWQNLDDLKKVERAEDALTQALHTMGVLKNDRWREISQVKHAFHDALSGRLGQGWRNGRAWLHLYRGHPDRGGRELTTLSAQWVLLKRQHSIGIDLDVGTGDTDRDVSFSLRVPWFGIYLGASRVLPRGLEFHNPGQKYPSSRTLGATWHSGALWVKLWCDESESMGRAPWWDARSRWRSFAIHPADLLLGRTRCREQELSTVETAVPMPEGRYPATVTLKRRLWKRARWPWPKVAPGAEVELRIPIPVPGKGENSYDCEDTAIFSQSCGTAATVEQALESVQQSALRSRLRYGGFDWVPAAGWPAEVQ
jgi:hypothetical protein